MHNMLLHLLSFTNVIFNNFRTYVIGPLDSQTSNVKKLLHSTFSKELFGLNKLNESVFNI